MKCTTCGRDSVDTSQFCGECGAAFNPIEIGNQQLVGGELPAMPFSSAVQTCFRRYFDFKGRATRAEYWWFYLFIWVGSTLGAIIDGLLGIFGLIQIIFVFGTLIPLVAVAVRRLHDINKSCWWLLLSVTGFGVIPLLIWWVRQGDAGANKYGADPRQAPPG